jgi:transcriptional regulator with XRE-family HTH domain
VAKQTAIEQKHGPDCTCTRCAGFGEGNELALKHGAYSSLKLGPRVAELADEIREVAPVYSPADEAIVRLLATTLSRIERASVAIDVVDDKAAGKELAAYTGLSADSLQRLRSDLRGWINTARRLANDLGMTPTSRARLGLDIVRGRGEALRAHLANKRAGAETIDAEGEA